MELASSNGRWVGIDDSPRTSIGLDDASANAAFYQLARIHHLDAHGPSSINGREVTPTSPPKSTPTPSIAPGRRRPLHQLHPGGSVTGTFTLDSPQQDPADSALSHSRAHFSELRQIRSLQHSGEMRHHLKSFRATRASGYQLLRLRTLGRPFCLYGKGSCEVTRQPTPATRVLPDRCIRSSRSPSHFSIRLSRRPRIRKGTRSRVKALATARSTQLTPE